MTITSDSPAGTRPFTVQIAQSDLDDLRDRLDRTRFAPAVPGDAWEYGTPEAYLRNMIEQWKRFDWRAVEDRINAVPNHLTQIGGQTIHFVHARSAVPGARALLLAHTYPGSFLEFLPLIDALTDPVAHGGREIDAFHVVIPSMPGFAFSNPVLDTGWTMARVAATYDTLMRQLGYDSYGIHGSDAGALVGRELAVRNPDGFLGAHVLQLFSFPSGDPTEFEAFGPKEHAALAHMRWFQGVGGYNAMNGSRPQTVAAALSDSPVGQLAYSELFENFGNGTSLVTPRQVLEQVTLYWLTNTAAGSVRYHYEAAHTENTTVVAQGRIGVAVFGDDFQTIRSLAERDNARIEHWSEFARGGHFAALEAPDDIVADLRVFFG
jgi:pimeloyl-ACP methyl ester carboxylesterase